MNINSNIAMLEEYFPGKTVPGAVKLSSNENPLGPSPAALKAVKKEIGNIFRYPQGSSVMLREQIAKACGLSGKQIAVGNGSDELFVLLALAWLDQEQNAVSARETFSQYKYATMLRGADFRQVPLKSGKFNLDAIAESVDSRTGIVYLCNPNNPTGTYFTHDQLDEFMSRVTGRNGSNVIVLLDEAYAEYSDAEDFPDSFALLEKYPGLVISRTFSKIYGLAGLRIGYAAGDETLIQGIRKASAPFNVNLLAQKAAAAAISDRRHVEKSKELVSREKKFLYAGLTELGFDFYPTQSNFICIDINRDAEEFWRFFASGGIALRSLKSFGLPDMVRYTIGHRKENRLFIKLLAELKGQ